MTPNGFYKLSTSDQVSSSIILLPSDTSHVLNETADVQNGQVVEFSCSPGYTIQVSLQYLNWLNFILIKLTF